MKQRELRLYVPLLWRGREVYDHVWDEIRGGWLWGSIVLAVELGGFPRSVKVSLRLCYFWRFGSRPMELRR